MCVLQCYTAFTVLLVPRLFGGCWQCRWTAARGDRESPFCGVTNYDRVWRKSAEDWGFESVLVSCQLWPEQRRPSKMCVTRRIPRQYYLLPVVFVVVVAVASIPQLKPWGSPGVGWDGSVRSHFPTPVCSAVHKTAISAMLPTTPAAYSAFRNFSNGVFVAMRIARGQSDPDMGLLTQQAFCFSPSVLAGDSEMLVMTMSV